MAAALAAATTLVGGCDVPKSFIDPSEMGRYEKTPLQKPILSSLSSIDRAIDDPTDEFTNATEVRPEDLVVVPTDYVIGSNDLVNVSISDLAAQGLETTKQTRVSESGNISLPLIGQVHADGLTEDQLQNGHHGGVSQRSIDYRRPGFGHGCRGAGTHIQSCGRRQFAGPVRHLASRFSPSGRADDGTIRPAKRGQALYNS